LIRVDLSEWAVRLSPSSVLAGPVAFQARNPGRLGHELLIIRTDLAPDSLPTRQGLVDEELAGEVVGQIKDLRRGRQDTRTLELSEGRYALICNVVGHYQLGMRTGLEVRP
jgi:uncharacterized cupredoxin-like copper-binding protein